MILKWLKQALLRVKALFRRKQLDRDLQDELAFHLEMREKKNRDAGVAEEEARYAARRGFGNVSLARERARQQWTFVWLESLAQDVRYAVRTLRKSPAFSVVAILTLGAAIGINAGIFQIFNAVALRPVEVGNSRRLLSVYQTFHVSGRMHRNVHNSPNLFSYLEYKSYRDQNQVFSGLLAYDPFVEVTLAGEEPRSILGTLTSCNYFEILGVRPALGRAFTNSDCASSGSGAVAILSDELWKSAFAGDPSIIGKEIRLNRVLLTIVGVAPAGFVGTEIAHSAFWAPLTMQSQIHANGGQMQDMLADDDLSWLKLIGRARDDVSDGEILADLGVIAGQLDQHHRGFTTHLSISPPTFFDAPNERKVVVGIGSVILAAVGLVLLIACANVANLLLARAAARRREIAVRLATGASRGRLIRQLLTESVLLALLGGVLGSLLAFWSFDALLAFVLSRMPQGFPTLNLHLGPDIRVLAYVSLLTALTAIAFGLAPALQATRVDVSTQLKEEIAGRHGNPVRGNRLRRSLVGLQVAVSMVLLIVAGLLLRGLYRAQTIDPGFDIADLQALSFDLSSQQYSPDRAAVLQRDLVDRISAMPGVEEVAQATSLPLGNSHNVTTASVAGGTNQTDVELNFVSANFFTAINVPIVRGRAFTEAEAHSGAESMILTETSARVFFPALDPVGKRLVLHRFKDISYEIVGVAKDAQVANLGNSHTVYVYMPAGPAEQAELRLLVRPDAGFKVSEKQLRSVVATVDPQLTGDIHPLTDYLEFWRAPARLAAGLSVSLGTLALLLACAGVYGTVCFAVNSRVHEIGVRMALGADRREVMRLILRQAMQPVLIGAAIGVVCCAGVSWGLSVILFGLSARDPLSFFAVPLFLLAVALVASYLPARQATRIDPIEALRYE